MDLNKIEELINVLEGSHTQELSVRKGEFSVHIKKGRKTKQPRHTPKPALPAALVSNQEPTHPGEIVLAPMVGVFHEVEGALKAGAAISKGQVVGAIESMKLLNDVVSEISGVVSEVLVEDGMPVEYGQALARVE